MGYGQPNFWRLPLTPTPAASSIPISQGNFQRGAVALAANGIAIFNPKNNRGDVAYEIGELDAYGGHCGMADDYHYHIIPTHLLSAFGGVLTNDKPVAWALDGYPIYGFLEPDGTSRAPLDADGGHDIGNGWGYHYHAIGTATTDAAHPYGMHQAPYLMSAFHGTVVNYGGQVDGQPEVAAIRADGSGGYSAKAVSGASIVAFKNPVALSTDGLGNLAEDTSPGALASPDQFLMRTLINGTTYDQCWRINRAAIAKTLTITWRMPAAAPVTTTYNNNNNRLTSYAINSSSVLKLPDTSQTADTTGSFGEDADYSINPQSFTDNNNGTVTDNVTGLMWQKTDNGESTWETALANASGLALGGFTDWRLPTSAELFSIFNFNNGNPAALDATYFPSNSTGAAEYWWSIDGYGSSTTAIWCANSGGGLGGKPKTETLSAGGAYRYHARYVRGGNPSNTHNYLNNLDGTITDLDTGLMWTQIPAAARTWEQALSYVEGLTFAGASDWRLPSIKELQTLTDYTLATATSASGVKPSINRTVFSKTLNNCVTTMGNTAVTCSDTTGLLVGMPLVDVVNAGSLYLASAIPPTVTAITSGTSFTMSSNALKSGSGLIFKALALPTAYWSSTSLKGDSSKAWLLETGINNSVPASSGPTRNGQGIISYEAKTSAYPIFAVRTTSVASQIGVSQDTSPLTDGASSVRFSSLGAKSFTISNNGVTSLILNGISIDGSDADKFTLSDAPAQGTTLSSGGSISFSVTYGNAFSGATHSAVLHITSSDPIPGAAFDVALSGSLPVIAAVSSSLPAPIASDAPYVTARISVPSDKALRSTDPVQLTYTGAAVSTTTVFSETMAKAASSSWNGLNADNIWTLNARGSDHIQQSAIANHSTVLGAGTYGLSMTKGSLAFSDTQVTSLSINAEALKGSANPAYAEFYLQTPPTNSGTYGWSFQTAPNGTEFATRLSETTIKSISTGTFSNGILNGGKHGWLQYRYDLSDAERVSTLKMRFQFIGGDLATSSVYIDDIVVKTTNPSPLTLAMYDDGLHGDGGAGDGVYGAQVPPQAAGTSVRFSVSVNFSDGSSSSLVDAGSYTTTLPVSITSNASLPDIISGAPYAQTLAASGGLSNYVWGISNGSLPTGLALSTAGIISGTATVAGTFTFTVTATDSAGHAASKAFLVGVNTPPFIISQPASLTVNAGTAATLAVTTGGTAPLSYQWRKDGVPIAGGTQAIYTLASVQALNAGSYDLVVTNIAGSVTSATAILAVNTAPVINSQPASLTVNAGTAAVFAVTASGTEPLSYQWRKDGVSIAGGTQATYALTSVQALNAGTYDVVVRNMVGSVTSAGATLALNTPPFIISQPASLTVNAGTAATFVVTAGGTAPLSYQWRKGGVYISGANSSSYSIPTTTIADEGTYDVIVANPTGSVSSNVATLSLLTPPFITRPSGLQLTVDGSGTLTAQVQSTSSYSYYWKRNGVSISSPSSGGITLFSGTSGSGTATAGTAISLELINANDCSEGAYTLVVSNSFGPVESGSATVAVDFSKPKILEVYLPKANVTYDLRAYNNGSFSGFPNPAVNESVALNVRGPAGMTYTWSFMSGTLGGGLQPKLKSTSSTLTFASESPRPPGYYKCTVSAPGGGIYTSIKFWVASFGPEVLIPGAGTYVGLLESSDNAVGDSGRSRGIVNFTLTSRGVISGVIRYTEAAPLSGGRLQQRVYRPLSQSFVSKLTRVNGSQSQFACTPQLGVGAAVAMRELTMDFDCSTTPPVIQAKFRDHGSIASSVRADGALSQVNRFDRISTGLPAGFEGAVGRSIILSNALGSATNRSQMYSLVQVLASGRAVWMTRMPGYTGATSTSLGVIDGTRLEWQVYEARISRSMTTFASESIFGRLSLAQEQDGKWKMAFGHGLTDCLVERQSSRLAIPSFGVVTPTFQAGLFAQGTNWTDAMNIDFSAGNGLRWIKTSGWVLPAFLPAKVQMRLRVTDPIKSVFGNPVSYAWDTVILTNGTVSRPLPVTENGVTPPTLTLQLDALTGQWTGGYVPANGSRRVLMGAVGSVQESPTERSRGWVELSGEVPVLHIGSWKLEVR